MSLFEIIKSLNWVDIVIVILFARTVYIAVQGGLLVEFFKTAGTVLGIYLSLHFYTRLSASIVNLTGAKDFTAQLWVIIAYLLLFLAGYGVLLGLRKLFLKFVKVELAAGALKWGGFCLGVARGFLVVSLVLYAFVIAPLGYFGESSRSSLFGKYFFPPAPATYEALWNGVTSKFSSEGRMNPAVLHARQAFAAKPAKKQ